MLSGIATAILDNILTKIFDNIDNKSVDDEHIWNISCFWFIERLFGYKQRLLSIDMKTKVVQHVPRIKISIWPLTCDMWYVKYDMW